VCEEACSSTSSGCSAARRDVSLSCRRRWLCAAGPSFAHAKDGGPALQQARSRVRFTFSPSGLSWPRPRAAHAGRCGRLQLGTTVRAGVVVVPHGLPSFCSPCAPRGRLRTSLSRSRSLLSISRTLYPHTPHVLLLGLWRSNASLLGAASLRSRRCRERQCERQCALCQHRRWSQPRGLRLLQWRS
jgi:hypothetical protein